MAVFASMSFVLVVAASYIAVQLPVAARRSTLFGYVNLVALLVLFGWRATVSVGAVALLYWAVLALLTTHSGKRVHVVLGRLVPAVLYGSVAVLFVLHKMVLEPGNQFSGLVGLSELSTIAAVPAISHGFELLQLLAFSYVALRIVDAIRAVLAGERLLDLPAFFGYLVPFFMTPSGPINEYEEHVAMDEVVREQPTLTSFVDSLYLIVLGYFLKFTCAQSLALIVRGLSDPWPVGSVSDTAIFLFFVLMEFSGYSLIAYGVGQLLGLPTPMNFNKPWRATSFADFWTRWHMSLGSFVRRTMYFPMRISLSRLLRPDRDERLKIHAINTIALLTPFAFVGVWHRFSVIFLLWGLAVGTVVALETIIREELPRSASAWLPNWASKAIVPVYSVGLVVLTLHIAMQDFSR